MRVLWNWIPQHLHTYFASTYTTVPYIFTI